MVLDGPKSRDLRFEVEGIPFVVARHDAASFEEVEVDLMGGALVARQLR